MNDKSAQHGTGEYRSTTRRALARSNLLRRLQAPVTVTPPPAGVTFESDVPVEVRDGTTLRVNVFRPELPGSYPVILSAQTYGKDKMPANSRSGRAVPLQYRFAANSEPISFSAWTALEAPDPAFWVPQGYVVLSADLRGWGTSGGKPQPFDPQEGEDVHDLVEWAAAQPWSNGRVGMSGVSYLAICQWTAAATAPPHLAAITPWEGFTDGYRDFAYPGGVREDGFTRVWSAWQRLLKPGSQSFRRALRQHPLRDAWWEQRSPGLETITVPALVCASFSDHSLHSRGSFEGFRRIASKDKWLYTHRGPKWSSYYSQPALAVQQRFFDRWLRDDHAAMNEVAPVRVEIRESRTRIAAVRPAAQWPPTEATPVTLHLDVNGGRMAPEPPRSAGAVAPQSAGAAFRWRVDSETDVVGPMRLRVPVSTQGGDLTLFAGVRKFHDGREVVFEGSYGFTEDIVTRGWLRLSHRAVDDDRSSSWEAWHPHTAGEPLAAGDIAVLDLTLLPSATRFAAGDELVLELRDRWFFPRNQLTGQFPAIYQHSRPRSWTIHTGGSSPATLTVPVWPGATHDSTQSR